MLPTADVAKGWFMRRFKHVLPTDTSHFVCLQLQAEAPLKQKDHQKGVMQFIDWTVWRRSKAADLQAGDQVLWQVHPYIL